MTNGKKRTSDKSVPDIDAGLGGMLGALGQAVSEIIEKLDAEKSGEVLREYIFDTDNGPVRAHAGVKLRVGGLSQHPTPTPAARPINREARRPRPAEPTQPSYDLFEEATGWILSADLPGVGKNEIALKKEGGLLIIETNGKRRYRLEVALSAGFDLPQTEVTLRNGILHAKIAKSVAL